MAESHTKQIVWVWFKVQNTIFSAYLLIVTLLRVTTRAFRVSETTTFQFLNTTMPLKKNVFPQSRPDHDGLYVKAHS